MTNQPINVGSDPIPAPVTSGAQAGHLVLMSVLVLVGMAFVFQGIGNSSPGAHQVILALLVGVVLLLGINMMTNKGDAGHLNTLSQLPWLPQGG
jgi:hypothetical protein